MLEALIVEVRNGTLAEAESSLRNHWLAHISDDQERAELSAMLTPDSDGDESTNEGAEAAADRDEDEEDEVSVGARKLRVRVEIIRRGKHEDGRVSQSVLLVRYPVIFFTRMGARRGQAPPPPLRRFVAVDAAIRALAECGNVAPEQRENFALAVYASLVRHFDGARTCGTQALRADWS
eukprot:COSAG01_NODE_7386_length_3228_cov_2.367732_2_plen_179_part_00